MKLGTIVLLVALGLTLALSLFIAYSGLGDMPTAGWVALIAGVVLSLAVGIGLMSLLFFSSRRGYDEPPRLEDKSSQ